MIGKTISHYKILEKLGQGGMGEVYLAEDSKLHRKVALKFLFQQLYEDHKNKARFEREAQAAAALTHPNIVVVYEIDEFEGQIYISMEYIQGESLRYYIDNQKLSLNESLEIILQICQGLSRAHDANIVHRDIKPENIMIGRDVRAKIVDFGLAKLKNLSSLTTLRTQIGTIAYMSPEQTRGADVDHRTDIWALGAVIYEMITGKQPFTGDYEQAVIYSIMNEEPEPLPDVPEDLYKIIEKALKKKREERYSTAREMFLELHTIQRRLEMDEGASSGGNVGLKSPSNLKAGVDNIRDLLSQRQKIDNLIVDKYTKDVMIMFSDVVSSVAYFEHKGDVSGRAMLHRYTHLMVPLIEQHSGHMIKTSGDAILAYFTEAANGCRCSIAMQKVLRKQTLAQPEEDRIAIRIALHFGRAVIEKDDVYGDIVNVAARVEQRASANEILLSDSVFQQVKDNSEFALAFVCKERLKGKSEKIDIYRLQWQENELIMEKTADKGKSDLSPADGSFAHSPESAIGRDEAEISRRFDPQMGVEGEEKGFAGGFKNPYMNRVKIKNIDEFYGRKSEVFKIFSRIGSSRPQSVSIVGERRIGKSSLLNYLCHPKIGMTYLQRPNDYRFVFIDFQEKRGIGIPTFFQSIYAFLLDDSKGGLALDVQPDYEGFKKVVTTYDQHGLNIIMLFDEFESITQNQKFDTEFYSFLRAIANNYNVGYVVSSGRNLQTLCHSRAISDSPFFNIFSNITLTHFSQQEALELITGPSQELGYSLEYYAPFVFDIAGYYPFFIQMACAVLFEYVRSKESITDATFERVKEEFLDEAKVHFQQIWDTCDDDQRDVFLRLCHREKIPNPQKYVLTNLIKGGYAKVKKNQTLVFSSLFEEFILERYSAKMARKKKKLLFWSL